MTMMDFDRTTDLGSLVATIACSPIVLATLPTSPRDFADWCDRQNGDLDTVVLDWLRSQVPQRIAH